jgi:hypothetical protein
MLIFSQSVNTFSKLNLIMLQIAAKSVKLKSKSLVSQRLKTPSLEIVYTLKGTRGLKGISSGKRCIIATMP